MAEVRRGDLWWVDWSPSRGSEQSGRRPALVVQTDTGNCNSRYTNTIVVTVSSQGRAAVPTHVRLAATEESGLKQDSYAKCEQVLTISKDRLERKIGRVSATELRAAYQALIEVVGP